MFTPDDSRRHLLHEVLDVLMAQSDEDITQDSLKMYELGTLSSQEAATLANVSRQVFLQLLRQYQMPPFEGLDEHGAPIAAVETLSDADIVRLAHMQMPAWQSRRLHELLDQQQDTPLAPAEGEELTALLHMHDRALLLKSEAMVEVVRRGRRAVGPSASRGDAALVRNIRSYRGLLLFP